jgi:hypothetical protein
MQSHTQFISHCTITNSFITAFSSHLYISKGTATRHKILTNLKTTNLNILLVLQNIDNADTGSGYYCDVSFEMMPIK